MSKMKKILSRLLLPLFVVSIALSGCQLPKNSTTTVTVSADNSVLHLYGIDPLTLDPALVGDAGSHDFILQIFSGLVTLDDNLQPVPDIAKSLPLISSDGTVYTFTLKQGVKFQDGREVKAGDFKYSWERACNPATGSQTAGAYLNDIVGVTEMLAGQATSLSGVKVIDDYTLQVTIDAPRSYFLYKLTYPTAFVVDKNNVNKGTDW